MADENGLAALGFRQELDVERFIDFASAIPHPRDGSAHHIAVRRFLTSTTINSGLNNLGC